MSNLRNQDVHSELADLRQKITSKLSNASLNHVFDEFRGVYVKTNILRLITHEDDYPWDINVDEWMEHVRNFYDPARVGDGVVPRRHVEWFIRMQNAISDIYIDVIVYNSAHARIGYAAGEFPRIKFDIPFGRINEDRATALLLKSYDPGKK